MTEVEIVGALLLGFGSVDDADTVAVLESWVICWAGGCVSFQFKMPLPSTVTTIRTILLLNCAMSPRATVTVPLVPTAGPGFGQTVSGAILQLRKFVKPGSGSDKVTAVAAFGPLFVTLMV